MEFPCLDFVCGEFRSFLLITCTLFIAVFIWYIFQKLIFCSFFKEILKKQSRQDEPVKLLPSSGAALMKSQK